MKTALPENRSESSIIFDSGASGENLIEIRDLYKNFGKLEVLKGISLNVHKGDVIVLIGPSGSGKSTLLRTVNMLEKPTAGSVLFEGVDLTKQKRKELCRMRERMGMVFQQFNLFPHLKVKDNITVSPRKVKGLSQEEAEKKAEGPRDGSGRDALRRADFRAGSRNGR